MTRIVRNAELAGQVVAFPVTTPAYAESSLEPSRYTMWLRQNREFAPFQAGELVLVNIGTMEAPRLRLARVYVVLHHHQERGGYLIPLYRVQLCTKDGTWSRQWRDCYPGDIYRAFFGPDRAPRPLPETITLEWVRAQA